MSKLEIRRFNDCDEAYHGAAFDILELLSNNADKKILYLASGGSSTNVTASITKRLSVNITNSVTFALVDERWGEVGHPDSNWEIMKGRGFDPDMFFSATQILDEGTTLENAASNYGRKLQSLIDQNDIKIALLGVGADGSLSGIMPGEAADFDRFFSDELAVGYKSQDFERITITPRALLQMDEIFVYACGNEKKAVINSLDKDIPLNESPIHMLKKMNKVTIYFSPKE